MDPIVYLRFFLALALVVGLVLLAGWAGRRFGLVPVAGGRRTRRGKRLGLVEVMPLDSRRRLVLVRRDGTEHLLLLSAGRDLVIETGIAAPAAATAAVGAAEEPAPAPAAGATATADGDEGDPK